MRIIKNNIQLTATFTAEAFVEEANGINSKKTTTEPKTNI